MSGTTALVSSRSTSQVASTVARVETVNVQEAKTRLSELLHRVERGERIVIARSGVPVARLEAVEKAPPRTFGTMAFHIPDTCFDPLPDRELEAWD